MSQKIKKENKGGARKGAGRKPVEDPKVLVPLYVKSSVLSALGGLDEVRDACYGFLETKVSESKNK
jgi:hypothetical protein